MSLDPRSLDKLQGVHPALAKVIREAADRTTFRVTEGLRDRKRQAMLVKARKSKTLNSRHISGHAIDFIAIGEDGIATYDAADMTRVAGVIKGVAAEQGVKVAWGGDWTGAWDMPHVELCRGRCSLHAIATWRTDGFGVGAGKPPDAERPMPVSMYLIAIPSFQKHLHALDGLIDKAAAYAAAKKIAPETLLGARLYPDMFHFTRQVQESCKFAALTAQRLAGVEIPAEADGEKTFADLKARIGRTLEVLAAVKPEAMDGSQDLSLTIKVGPNDMSFTGRDYLLHFALPNFYFHCSTAYGILRHNGVEIGKRDFMRRT